MPFLLMKQSATSVTNFSSASETGGTGSIDLAYVYGFFRKFVQIYIPNTMHTKLNERGGTSLPYLKCTLTLTEILLQFHDKELYNHLTKHKLVLEMFATNWFLTLFTRVVSDLALLYELWEIFLFERDRFLIFYLGVAMLTAKRKTILGLNQFEQLMKYLTTENFKVSDFAQLSEVYDLAVKIRTRTPVSYQCLVTKLHLFNQESAISIEELAALETFKGLPMGVLQIQGRELLQGHLQMLENSTNNNKYLNMMMMQKEDEEALDRTDEEETTDHTVYLLPFDLLSQSQIDTGGRETITMKGLPEEIPKSVRDGIAKVS